MNSLAVLQIQMEHMSWHDGGLFMGMHWLWWSFWILVIGVLLSAFWRLHVDRKQTQRAVAAEEHAEGALRRRFANGEIDEDEYAARLEALRETMLGR